MICWWLILESCLNTFKDLLRVIFLCKDNSVIRIGNSKRISYRNYEFWMSFHGRPLRINTVSDSILYSFVFYLTVLEKQLYLYLERCWQNVISHLQKYCRNIKKNILCYGSFGRIYFLFKMTPCLTNDVCPALN